MKHRYEKTDFGRYKKQYSQIAKELGYGRKVAERIMDAESEDEINIIMISARKGFI